MDIEAIKKKTFEAIRPLKSIDSAVYGSSRTDAGYGLPEHYLAYFLLVDLLEFNCLGRHEKLAWSVPIELGGKAFYIEHRKMGLGLFTPLDHKDEDLGQEVVRLVNRGVRVAQPYFNWRAEQAVNESAVNVRNRCTGLYDRFEFLLAQFNSKMAEAEANDRRVIRTNYPGGGIGMSFPKYQLIREAEWLAISVIESFFSWTEHAFVHLAILQGKCVTGIEIKNLAAAEWKEKFKTALGLDDPDIKRYYDRLMAIRYQVRNFVAHGAFGKAGEAFLFHSGAGAVPVQLPHRRGEHSYRFPNFLEFAARGANQTDQDTIEYIQSFIEYIRSGPLAPAWVFLDEGSDVVLTLAQDGTYELAMASEEAMNDFLKYWSYLEDIHANMDF